LNLNPEEFLKVCEQNELMYHAKGDTPNEICWRSLRVIVPAITTIFQDAHASLNEEDIDKALRITFK
jgi:hypothetical protein